MLNLKQQGDVELNIGKLIEKNALKFPDKTAVVYEDKRYTYCEFNSKVNRLSNALSAYGLKKQQKIGIISQNIPQYLECIFACAKTNMCLVTLNWRLNPKEILELLQAESLQVIFFQSKYIEIIKAIEAIYRTEIKYVCLDGKYTDYTSYEALIESNTDIFEPVEDIKETDVLLMFFTSGTTGNPKGVLMRHCGILAYMLMYIAESGWDSNVIYQYMSPFFHISGISACIALIAGGTLVLMNGFSIKEYLSTVQKEKSNRLSLVPNVLKWVLDYKNLSDYDLSSVDTIVYSSAPMPPDIIQRAVNKLNCKFVQGYGMTEMGIISMLKPEDHILTGSEEQKKRLYSVGMPIIGVEIKVVDEKGTACGEGDVGEIVSRSPAMMLGYNNYVLEADKSIKYGWYYTGDLGYFDKYGYLYLVGRKKDVIISGGENIYPKQIENCIRNLENDIDDVAVIGVPDEKWGEAVKAFVVKKPFSEISEGQIMKFCSENLASYKKPKYIEFIDELPKNENGKVQKNKLRNQNT